MAPIISVSNVSKQYRLGEVGTGSLQQDLNRWWHKLRGKEDPYLQVGDTNDRSTRGSSDYVWALRNISFEVQPGEVLGIIGRNGAGKSTLLKILSRVTEPTTGRIAMRGRMASLLEVGTGFHPELTGRENIYLNGAILGMTKKEINSRFDEIVAFAGVERYIDTPVKRYSSGMHVRLGFAVAAHLEPDVLIVDEVLAVGDYEFQKKCLGKMREVSQAQGRTILFVSHNMTAIQSLCSKGLLLENGAIAANGDIASVMAIYQAQNQLQAFADIHLEKDGLALNSVSLGADRLTSFDIDKALIIDVSVDAKRDFDLINIVLFFKTIDGATIFATSSVAGFLEAGSHIFSCEIPANTLNDILYAVDVLVVKNGEEPVFSVKDVLTIEGVEPKRNGSWLGKFPGLIRPTTYNWKKERVK
ncbi:MAG: polysaccharide ABC transporter ATP-binding protein [Chitinophagaceae bacterium]|jgi:lipopolysaccharide transport system ATP-binding protein|nr:polysaccharide ABC transporter ATP-binding protein [Chitinophagaceae bacterium]